MLTAFTAYAFAEVVLELWPEDERALNAGVLCLEEHRKFLHIHGLSLEIHDLSLIIFDEIEVRALNQDRLFDSFSFRLNYLLLILHNEDIEKNKPVDKQVMLPPLHYKFLKNPCAFSIRTRRCRIQVGFNKHVLNFYPHRSRGCWTVRAFEASYGRQLFENSLRRFQAMALLAPRTSALLLLQCNQLTCRV